MATESNLKLIAEVEAIRSRNNTAWMDLVRLAFTSNPKQAKIIMRQITRNDKEITNKLIKLSK